MEHSVVFFRLKHILFQGKEYKIFMQSANGPCPLIAIVNALILKGLVSAADKYEEVTSEGVISFLMSYIRSHVKLSEDEGTRRNQLHDLDDIERELPNLLTGVDVNVRFDRCDSFEYTRSMLIFDYLSLRLLHGWIVDGDDHPLVDFVSKKTYNQVVDAIISGEDRRINAPSPMVVEPSRADVQMVDDVEQTIRHAIEQIVETAIEQAAEQPPVVVEQPPVVVEQAPVVVEQAPVVVIDQPNNDGIAGSVVQRPSGDVVISFSPSHQQFHRTRADSDVNDEIKSMSQCVMTSSNIVRVLKEFLESTATQLTLAGLCVNDNEICVFFRNNHFNTMYRNKGSLYLLATDFGFFDTPVVWIELDDIGGDETLCGYSFEPLSLGAKQQQQQQQQRPAVIDHTNANRGRADDFDYVYGHGGGPYDPFHPPPRHQRTDRRTDQQRPAARQTRPVESGYQREQKPSKCIIQ